MNPEEVSLFIEAHMLLTTEMIKYFKCLDEENEMSTTVLEALMNAEVNLNASLPFMKDIGLNQLHNAIVFLEKGYGAYDTMDKLLEEYEDRIDDIPEVT